MDTNKTITHLSLCSGYEGIGLGLRSVLPNLREIAYVEREGFPVANLVAKMEAGELDAAPVFTDVKTFPYRKFRGCVDILSGGFPCQPFSAAGKRKATEDPRHLFPYIADGIRECQPRIVFLENVAGIISAKTGDGDSVLQYVLKELEGLGYRATAGIFSAEEVGAPHQRKRVFIMGYSECMREPQPQGSEQDKRGRTQHSSEELGNTQHNGLYGTTESRGTTEAVRDNPQGEDSTCQSQRTDSPSELANGNHEGLEGYQRHSSSEQGEPIQADTWSAGSTRWPSRPSEPQYEWEEPRVVADTKGAGGGRGLRKLSKEDAGIRQPKKCRQKESSESNNASEEPRVVAYTKSKQGSSRDNGEEPRASSKSEESQSGGGHSGSLRESNGQAEPQLGRTSNGSTSRVDRLRLLGNGVVPATAAKAFVTLIQRLI